MNIVFFHTHAILPNSQGISKVLITLRDLFREKGHTVIAVAMRRLETDIVDDEMQFFLPSEDTYSPQNLFYLCELLKKYHIDRSISVCVYENEVRLISECCNTCKVPIVTALHNMLLTPVHNIDAVREYSLKKKHLSFIYYLIKTPIIKSLLCKLYILRHTRCYQNVYSKSDAVVLLNETMKNEFHELIGIKSSDKTFVIPNTLNEDPCEVNKDKDNVVLWVGKMDTSIKRPDLMLKVWEKVEPHHPNWHLMMLGKGDGQAEVVWNEMKSLSKELKLKNVSFEGQVVTKPYYERAKITCVTSTHESFSLVVAESLYNGVVPLAFNSFATASELINDGVNGLLVKPFDIKDYAKKLGDLMSDDCKLKNLQDNRMITMERYNKETVYIEWEHLFATFN